MKPRLRHFLGLGLLALLSLHGLWAQDGLDDEMGRLLGDKDMPGLEENTKGAPRDFAGLKQAHLSYVAQWEGVQPLRVDPKAPKQTWLWRDTANGVAPLGKGGKIRTIIAVPADGTYRVFLRHLVQLDGDAPVTLTLTPVKLPDATAPAGDAKVGEEDDGAAVLDPEAAAAAAGAADSTAAPKPVTPPAPKPVAAPVAGSSSIPAWQPAGAPLSHLFGKVRLSADRSGQQQEGKAPIRFESEPELIGYPGKPTMVWEYTDLKLSAGTWELALDKPAAKTVVSAVFLSQSKDFRPSFTSYPGDNSLQGIHLRFRLKDPPASAQTFAVTANLGYHWRGRSAKGSTEPAWSWPLGATGDTKAGEWSEFVDGTDAILPTPGPWSTCNLGLRGPSEIELELQFAWFPHEGAVMYETSTWMSNGAGFVRIPAGAGYTRASSSTPAWGLWTPAHLSRIISQEAIVERYFEWAQEAEKTLNLAPDHPKPREVRLYSGNGVRGRARERAAEMLAKLGVNWIPGAPDSIAKKYQLHTEQSLYNTADAAGPAARMTEAERAKLTKVKIGDEISTFTSPSVINRDPRRLVAFQDYMRQEAAAQGMSLVDFIGLENPEPLLCDADLPSWAGRYDRRLFYYSNRYAHIATIDGYFDATRNFEKYFPNVQVYNNYSPHPVFLTGTTMNHGDWFILTRNNAQTLAWGEDWATGGGWGLHTKMQCVSYYAAIVDAARRKHGFPGGFYVGSNCGDSARKIFSCLSKGLTILHLYDWGPIDRWAEGSNAWSEHRGEYYNVMVAAHAIGPADKILANGKREIKTGVLYNRSHEIWQGGTGRLNHDWMWTTFGLNAAQIPNEVIIEEDLNPETLKNYRVIYAGGYNLERRHLLALRDWVEAGGLLVGHGGFAMRDTANDMMAETTELFGASQRLPDGKDTAPRETATFPASSSFPESTIKPVGPLVILKPTTGQVLGTFDGGEPAAVGRTLGKGRTLLLACQPGFTFRANGAHRGIGREWLTKAPLSHLGRQRLEYEHTYAEATLFEHESGLAVMLNDFSHEPMQPEYLLSVQPNRPITEVRSALFGVLPWEKDGDRIKIKTKAPIPVDVIILK